MTTDGGALWLLAGRALFRRHAGRVNVGAAFEGLGEATEPRVDPRGSGIATMILLIRRGRPRL